MKTPIVGLALVLSLLQELPAGLIAIDLPSMPGARGVEAAVACRGAGGIWEGSETWRALESRVPRVRARSGCRVLVRATGESTYLASEVLTARHREEPARVTPQRFRMVMAPAAPAPVHWVGASSTGVECIRATQGTHCLFVPADETGALIAPAGPGLLFALSRAASGPAPSSWESAAWGRLVVVSGSRGARVAARVSALEPALRHGRGLLRRAQPSTAAEVHALADAVFWIAGRVAGAPADNERLELSGAGTAPARIPLSAVRGAPLAVLHLALDPEEIIEGDVRSEGSALSGATVTLMRLLPRETSDTEDEPAPVEWIAESVTDAAGRFRFDRLSRARYELAATHPRRGRARLTTDAPSVRRIILTPPAVIRGRVMRMGIPVPGAIVTILPSYDAITSARDPIALFSEPVQTSGAGRFEIALPEAGRVALTVTHEGASARLDLGEAPAAATVLDVGDIRLESALDVTIELELPASCVVAAAGPMGQPGMLLLRARPAAPGRWELRSAMEGRWFVEASCDGVDVPLETAVIRVSRSDRELIRLRVRRTAVP